VIFACVALAGAALAPFASVEVSGDVHVEIVRGADAKVDAAAPATADVKAGVLVVTAPATNAKQPLVKVTVTALTAVTARGASRVEVSGVDGKVLDVTAADSARVTLAGKSAQLRVAGAGTARVDAGELVVGAARVELTRAARAVVHARDSLDVDLAGASQCTAKVKPKRVDQKLTGAAKLLLP
jgi:hypothetical protein